MPDLRRSDVTGESDDPGPTPPPWEEQEWCDGGATCEHELCYQLWYEEMLAEHEAASE